MATTEYGSFTNDDVVVSIEEEEEEEVILREFRLPLSVTISTFLIGMWHPKRKKDQADALVVNRDLAEDDNNRNPTPDTTIGDASFSESIDLMEEAEVLNMKKRVFLLRSK